MTIKWTTWKKRINPWKGKIFQDSMLFNIGLCNIFFGSVSSGKEKKMKTNKWDYIKPNSFCTEKVRINKMKKSPTEWGKVYIE